MILKYVGDQRMHSIYVEGKADKKFINDFVKLIRPELISNVNMIEIGNYTQLKLYEPKMRETQDHGGRNVVIIDADDTPGIKAREVAKLEKEIGLQLYLFFLPDNRSDGNLEDLLLNCTVNDHQGIIECFDEYQRCIENKGDYTLPNTKAKVYAYCEAILPKKAKEKIQDHKRDYLDKNLWDIDNPYTKPLKDFLVSILY